MRDSLYNTRRESAGASTLSPHAGSGCKLGAFGVRSIQTTFIESPVVERNNNVFGPPRFFFCVFGERTDVGDTALPGILVEESDGWCERIHDATAMYAARWCAVVFTEGWGARGVSARALGGWARAETSSSFSKTVLGSNLLWKARRRFHVCV